MGAAKAVYGAYYRSNEPDSLRTGIGAVAFEYAKLRWPEKVSAGDIMGFDGMQWVSRPFMADFEVYEMSFFRSTEHQDFFSFMDSFGGFHADGWGNHAFRTLAVEMLAPNRPVLGFNGTFAYAHQDFCAPGPGYQCAWNASTKPRGSWVQKGVDDHG